MLFLYVSIKVRTAYNALPSCPLLAREQLSCGPVELIG